MSFTGLVSGTQLSLLPPGSRTRAVGGNMEFTTIKPPSPPFQEITWRFQGSLVITRLSGSDTFGSGYSGRVHLDTLTGSLELQNLTLQDSGEYTVSIRPEGGAEFSGKTNLTVLRECLLYLISI